MLKLKTGSNTRGELSCSALPVALPFYLTELRKVGAYARKILSQFKLLWFLNVFGNTLLAILHLEIAKNFFTAGSAEQLTVTRPRSDTPTRPGQNR